MFPFPKILNELEICFNQQKWYKTYLISTIIQAFFASVTKVSEEAIS